MSCRTDHCTLLLPDFERELRLNEETFKRAIALLRRVPEFTITATLRQNKMSAGTIVAFSHGNNRYTNKIFPHITYVLCRDIRSVSCDLFISFRF